MIIFFNDRCELMLFCYKLWDACFLSSDESIRDTCFDFETMFSNSFLLVWIARSKRGGWLKLLFVSKMPGAQLKLFVSIESIIILRASPPLHLARLVAAKKAHMVVASNLRCKVRCFFEVGWNCLSPSSLGGILRDSDWCSALRGDIHVLKNKWNSCGSCSWTLIHRLTSIKTFTIQTHAWYRTFSGKHLGCSPGEDQPLQRQARGQFFITPHSPFSFTRLAPGINRVRWPLSLEIGQAWAKQVDHSSQNEVVISASFRIGSQQVYLSHCVNLELFSVLHIFFAVSENTSCMFQLGNFKTWIARPCNSKCLTFKPWCNQFFPTYFGQETNPARSRSPAHKASWMLIAFILQSFFDSFCVKIPHENLRYNHRQVQEVHRLVLLPPCLIARPYTNPLLILEQFASTVQLLEDAILDWSPLPMTQLHVDMLTCYIHAVF